MWGGDSFLACLCGVSCLCVRVYTRCDGERERGIEMGRGGGREVERQGGKRERCTGMGQGEGERWGDKAERERELGRG